MAKSDALEVEEMADHDEFVNALVYGPSGCGKTVWCGTAPKNLFLATEQGTVSAKRMGSDSQVVRCRDWPKFERTVETLRKGAYKRFSTITLDSWTSLQDVLWQHILDLGSENNPARDPDIPYQQEHFKVQQVIKRLAVTFADMPVNFISTALPMSAESEDGEDLSLPQINGKQGAIAQFVMGQMSIVGHMVVEEGDRRIHWEHDPPHYGKDRYNVLGPYTENKSYADVIRMIERSGSRPARTTTRRTTGRRRSSSTRKAS